MAEVTLDLRHLPKEEAYQALRAQIDSVLTGIDDPIAGMATIAALTYHAFGHLWVGFYRVVEPDALLRVGPYQGTLGCLEIRFGSGVCGTCAADRRTVIVPNVEQFPGHITCDSRAKSEIVTPVFDQDGSLIAVFDLDSDRLGTFDDTDGRHLEHIVSWFSRIGTPSGASH